MAHVEPIATVVNGHTFTIDERYILTESRILGKGSFGVVCTAYDSVRKIDLAVKRIRPYANDDWDAKHTLREIRLLKLLGNHPNIISLYELSLFLPKTELYMYMELMDCDLHRVIQSKQALSEKHHKCFLKQMLEGIKAMHAIGVFHRDLKPGNILVSKDCQLRITDFGLARFMDNSTRRGENELSPMTQYVVTRWYRPPELLLAPNLPYGEAVDLWSIGCILAELLRRKPLFPGKSHLNQAQLIFELKGYTSAKELGFPVSAEAASFLDKKCRYRKQSIRKYVPDASEPAIHLLEQLLAVNPDERPSAEQALRHPFLADAEVLHDYSKTYLTKPTPDYFEFEHTAFTVPELRAMIEHEVEVCAADAYRYQQRGASPSGVKRRGQFQGGREETEEVNVAAAQRPAAPPAVAPAAAIAGKSGGVPAQQDGNRGAAAGNPYANTAPAPAPAPPAAGAGGAGAGGGRVGGQQAGGSAAVRRTSRHGEEQMMQDGTGEDGPPSQMPTPKQGTTATSSAAANRAQAQVQGSNAQQGRSERAAASNNPFRNQGQGQGQQTSTSGRSTTSSTGSTKERPKSSEEIGQAAAAYRATLLSSRSERDLQTEDATEVVPAAAIPAGNILAAVRNEANPSHIPAGSRTRQPKTPSPKKMDQILQRDALNKRRFLLQQQQQAQAAALADQQGAGEGCVQSATTRNHRYSLPNQSSNSRAMGDLLGAGGGAGSGAHHVRSQSASDFAALQALHQQQLQLQQQQQQLLAAQQQQQQQAQGQAQGQGQGQTSRFGKLIPGVGVPFPTIASRMSSIAGRSSQSQGQGQSQGQQGGSSRRGAGIASGGGGSAVDVSAAHLHHSNTIHNSGNNVIHSEYGPPSNQF